MAKGVNIRSDFVIQCVQQYAERQNITFNVAALELMVIGFHAWSVDNPDSTGFFGGSQESDSAMMLRYEDYSASGGELAFLDWLLDEFIPAQHGGKREGAGRKSTPTEK